MKALLKRWFKGAVKRDLGPAPSPAAPAPPPFLGGAMGGLGGRRGQLRAYQGWVYAAVSVIARRAAGVPLRVYGRGPDGARAELNDHPAAAILARPNPLYSGRALRQTLVTHLELTGMAFLLMAENAFGQPAELWPLSPADLIEIKSGPDTRRPISAFVFQTPGGKRQEHPPEKVLYFRHPSPASLIYGASPIEAMAHAFDIDLAIRIYQRNFFANSARPELVLSTDQRLTDQEARRILTGWRNKHQGLSHVFEPTILDGGLRAQPLTFSHKDFEFMALAGWTQDNILAAYGVPAGKLGLVKDVNRANALGIDITFNAECIRPRLDLIEDVLAEGLAGRFSPELEISHDNPVPSDREQAHSQAMDQLDRGVITVNELRAALGKPPVPWGDKPRENAAPAGYGAPALSPSPGLDPARQKELIARLEEHYPRLESRFNGWSAKRVATELAERPKLLAGLIPPGLEPASEKALRRLLSQCLQGGRTLKQTIEHIGPLGQGG